MKSLLAFAFISALVLSVPTHAASQPNPLVGQWSLDTSRMPIPAEARPKRVTITFEETGSNRLSMDVAIVYADGAEVHSTGTASLDGTPIAVEGSPEADTAAMKRPEPNVLVLGLSKGGEPASTRVYTVAPDGKSMTETVSALGSDRRPSMRTNYFTRLP
jgi:hypothetical protein